MSRRQIVGALTLGIGLIGLVIMLTSPRVGHTGSILPEWLWMVMGFWTWLWVGVSIIALLFMVFEVRVKTPAKIATIMWLVMFGLAFLDAIATDSPSHSYNLTQIFFYTCFLIGWPAVTAYDWWRLDVFLNR